MIFLVRHGQTDWNKNHVIQGQHTDVPLNETGIQQAKDRAKAFKDFKFDKIYTSPLKRAKQTAQIIAEACGMEEPVEDVRFIERDFGPIDGTKSTGHPLKFYFEDIDGAENEEDLFIRIREALEDLSQSSKNFLVVSHGGIIGSYVWHKLNRDDFSLVNTAVVAVDPETLDLVDFNLTNEEIQNYLSNSN